MDLEIYVATKEGLVTGFAERDLPHTSISINLGDHNLVFEYHISL